MNRIIEIIKRYEAATPAPWHATPKKDGVPWYVWADNLKFCSKENRRVIARLFSNKYKEDMHFIAHAREDIPWLVEKLEQVKKERDEAIYMNLMRDCPPLNREEAIAEELESIRKRVGGKE